MALVNFFHGYCFALPTKIRSVRDSIGPWSRHATTYVRRLPIAQSSRPDQAKTSLASFAQPGSALSLRLCVRFKLRFSVRHYSMSSARIFSSIDRVSGTGHSAGVQRFGSRSRFAMEDVVSKTDRVLRDWCAKFVVEVYGKYFLDLVNAPSSNAVSLSFTFLLE